MENKLDNDKEISIRKKERMEYFKHTIFVATGILIIFVLSYFIYNFFRSMITLIWLFSTLGIFFLYHIYYMYIIEILSGKNRLESERSRSRIYSEGGNKDGT
jgi:amino acid transporter